MALLQILLLLLYALPSSLLLPITSNPLGLEDTPDNLAWAAQSFESRPPEHEGVRKIPKSIFITPNHHPDYHANNCPNGYKWQDGHCVKVQNFDVDPLALITAQFQQNLAQDTTIDYDEYDYGDFDESTESTAPLHVPLSVSFDDGPPSGSYNDGIQNMPFLADNLDRNEETPQNYRIPTSTESKSTENMVPITPTTTATAGSNDDDRTDDDLANNKKDSTRRTEPTTTSSDMIMTTPDESILIFSDGGAASTTQKKVLIDRPDDDEENVVSTEKELDPTTTQIENEPVDGVSATVSNRQTDRNQMELTTQGDEQNNLEKELQSESLIKDDTATGMSSISVSDGTTEIGENDIEVTTEPLHSLNDKEITNAISISTPKQPSPHKVEKLKKPIVIVPTVEQVQIVTPVQQTTTSHSTTAHHRKQSTSRSTPSSTSEYNGELQTAERLNINESMLNKKLRESVMKHELNEDAIETIDTNNRFVYTHLDSSSNEPEEPSSSSSSSSSTTTMQPPVTQRSLLEQLRFISEDNRRNNRVRFPEPSAVNIFSNFKGGTIKFPGPVQQRTSEPLFNRLIPDHIPKKPPESSADRPLFSWLPAGTSFDFSRNSNPAFMRFWNKQPLIRDRSMVSNDSSERPRSNSKSPQSDNLYRDAPPASEVYKVISSKNYKHDNR